VPISAAVSLAIGSSLIEDRELFNNRLSLRVRAPSLVHILTDNSVKMLEVVPLRMGALALLKKMLVL
jgi:hypothetical protein